MFLRLTGILLFAIFCTSCAVRSVYVPTAQNVLLFDEKKQIQANAYAGVNTFQFQMAHNPLKHVNFGFTNCYGSGLTIYEGYTGVYNYGKEGTWRYEMLGGGGYTNNYSVKTHGPLSSLRRINTNYETMGIYTKAFLQPAFGFFSKISMYQIAYSFSFSHRFSYLHFRKYVYREIDVDNSPSTGPASYFVNKEYHNKNLFLLEPCITNKVARKNVAVVLQFFAMMPYSSQIDIRHTKFSPVFLFSYGVQYTFVFKRQKPPRP